jgi:cysteine-rich repeat protein
LLFGTGAGCSKGGEVNGALPDSGDTGATDGDIEAAGGSGGSGASGGTGGVSECSVNAECTDFDTCNGDELCVDNKCEAPAAPAPDGTECGVYFVCLDGLCEPTPNICHDGLIGIQEDCDDENTVSGDGCDNDCKFSCISTDTTRNCTPLDACEGNGVCNDATHTCSGAIPLPDGTLCATGKVCLGGVCSTPCVDGDPTGEECDDNNLIAGDGCDNDCTFSCLSTDTARDCAPTDVCQGTSTCNDNTHICSTRTPLADGTSCGSGMRCYTGKCCATTDTACQTVCSIAGTWGVKITTQVNWDVHNVVTLAGSGVIETWGKITRTVSGSTTTDRLIACGLTVPDFIIELPNAVPNEPPIHENIGLLFPTSIFDDHTLPTVTMTGTLSGVRVGDAYSVPSTATLLGIDGAPNDPTWDWLPECDAACTAVFNPLFTDHDQDNKPAITSVVKTGATYSYPPAGTLEPLPRVDQIYLAVRQVAALSGTLKSCTEISGVAGVTAQDSRITGCRYVADGTDCNDVSRQVLDYTKPLYRPTSASFTMKKLTSSATCATVRSSLP